MALAIIYANPGLPAQYFLDTDPTTFTGWGQTNAEGNSVLYRTDIPSIYLKVGPDATDWQVFGSGVTNPVRTFKYTVLGTEPDLSELVIIMPIPMAGAYNVFASCQGCTNIVAFDIPESSHTNTQFLAISTGNLIAGDVIAFMAIGI